ncbi:MAG: hypothetical protein F6J97_22565, partial [Leptolyngbya sp. SIO4C1]|nr:hypothetical protein [Leptolyngbya sp. SIO4C1]
MRAYFSDIQDYWAEDCINQLAEHGIIQGYADGHFKPDKFLTRAEFAALLKAAFPNAKSVRKPIKFTDLSEEHWAFAAIQFAYQTGFLLGYPQQRFNPDVSITREQAIVALANGLGYAALADAREGLTQYFEDAAEILPYAETAIAAATQAGLIVNYPNLRQLRPQQTITRGELSALLCRALRFYSAPLASVVGGAQPFPDADSFIVAAPRYNQLGDFSEGLAQVTVGTYERIGDQFDIQDARYGFINRAGQMQVPLQHEKIYQDSVSDGLALFTVRDETSDQRGGQKGYIDTSGNVAIAPRFTQAESFVNGLAIVSEDAVSNTDKRYGYIDRQGDVAIAPQFRAAQPFHAGLAAVVGHLDRQERYIDSAGNTVFETHGMQLRPFSEGLASAKLNDKSGYVDLQGNVVVDFQYEPQYDAAQDFSEERAWVARQTQAHGWFYQCIDRSGHFVSSLRFKQVEPFANGWARVNQGDRYKPEAWGYLSRGGEFSTEFNYIRPFSAGLAAVWLGDRQGYIDESRTLVISAQFEAGGGSRYQRYPEQKRLAYSAINDFSEGLAAVSIDGQYGYINTLGNIVIAPQFDYVLPFSEGLAAVQKGDQVYYIDPAGSVAFPYPYDGASLWGYTGQLFDCSFLNGLAIVVQSLSSGSSHYYYGLMDKAGQVVVPPQFTQIRRLDGGLIQVTIGSEVRYGPRPDSPARFVHQSIVIVAAAGRE